MNAGPRRGGNRTDVPTRSFHVTRDELERAVRETFSQQVAASRPLAADPAGAAIRRARRIQRQRALTGLALAAVATVAVSTGVAQLGAEPRRPTQPTVVLGDPYASGRPTPLAPSQPVTPDGPSSGAGVDVIVGDALIDDGGRRVALDGVGPAERAQRLPENAGWLVVGRPTAAGRSLWAVPRDSVAQVLLAGADAIVVAADGRQVAWRDGDDVVAAGIVGSQLIAPVRSPAPPGAVPVGFVGDAVLVRLDPARPGHALWRPAVAPLAAGTDKATLNLYGVLPDGRVVGQVRGAKADRPCLALLDPARELSPERTGCGPALSSDGLGAVSTDGHWLVVNGRDGDTDAALLVDLTRLGTTLSARRIGPPLTGAVSWRSAEDAAYVDGAGRLVRVRVERVLAGEAATVEPVTGGSPTHRPVVVTGS